MSDRLPSVLETEVVDAIENLNGVSPGHRRVHARGICFKGSFTPTGDAATRTTAAHLQTTPVPAAVRISNASSDPDVADGQRGAGGLAVRFRLADGPAADIVSINVPAFVPSTPQRFLDLVAPLERGPGPGASDPAQLKQYATDNPHAAFVLQAGRAMGIPVSYGTQRYWGAAHAFTWVNAEGVRRSVRHRWEPDVGVEKLAEERDATEDPCFFAEERTRRIPAEPVGLALRVQLAEDGDPTRQCPADRTEIVAGRLDLTAVVVHQAPWEAEVFDPTRISDGIELFDDPILTFRKPRARGVLRSPRHRQLTW